MCPTVLIGSTWCYSVGELREQLPSAELLKRADYKNVTYDSSCLCGIDLDATFNAAEIAFEKNDYGDYRVKPREVQKALMEDA